MERPRRNETPSEARSRGFDFDFDLDLRSILICTSIYGHDFQNGTCFLSVNVA